MIRKKNSCKVLLFVVISFLKVNILLAQPNTIPNLLLWLSADSSVIDDGSGNVVQWNDLTVNGYNFIQSTPEQRPSKVFSNMFRSDAIHFNGTLQTLINSSVLQPANFTSQRTSMIIFWGLNGTVQQYGVVATKDPGQGYWRYGGDGNGYFQNFRNSRLEAYPNAMPNSGIHISSLIISQTNYEMFMDGSSMGMQAPDWGTGADFNIGRDENKDSLDGEIVELILYNDTLSSTERQQIEQYLHLKYAPPVNLGSDIVMTDFCDTTLDAGKRYKSYLWSTGDTTQFTVVSSPGTYYVDVIDIFGSPSSDTIYVSYPSINEILTNSRVCVGDSMLWNTNLSSSVYSFLWNTGDTTSSIYIKNEGSYWVTVTDSLGCFKNSDTIFVAVDSFPLTASMGNDSIDLCIGNTLFLVQGASQAATYNWSTGATTSAIAISVSGSYHLTVIDTNGCSKTDSIYATIVGLPPVANFLSTSVCEGAVTQFTDSSYDPTTGNSVVSWFWDFGDNTTDTVQNPSHTFQTFGDHTVILTITSNYGCPNADTASVTVHPIPVASFVHANPCADVATVFNNTSTIDSVSSVANLLWNFGDPASGGNNSSAQANPTHVYDFAGNYIVSLITTSNFGCSDTAIDVLVVRPSSTPNFQYLPTCFGSVVQFTNLSLPASLDSAWRWNFGDGPGLNQLENPTHLYIAAQTYNVTLTIYAYGGCVTSAIKPVTVSPLPIAAFVHSPACVGVPYQFTDSSYISSGNITAWEWHFAGLDSSTSQNPVFTFPDTGNYIITLKVASNIGSNVNCFGSVSRTIHVNPLPVANFSFTPQYGNPPLSVSFSNLTNNVNANSYQWNFGDNGTSSLINPQHLYSDTSLFPIQMIATTPYGCMDTVQKNIYVIRPILDLAITGLSASYIVDNHLHIIVDLANLGTRPIDKFKIQSRLGDGTPIEEPFIETLPNGFSGQLELSSSLDLGPRLAKYYCVSAVKPNDTDDDVLQNNEVCKNLTNEFIVVNPYPNPFNDHLVFQLILPYKENISIEIFDLIGKKITVYEGPGHEGSNQFEADLGDLANGTYTVRFRFRETEIVKTIVKVEKKN
jgi:PKD repeat protein